MTISLQSLLYSIARLKGQSACMRQRSQDLNPTQNNSRQGRNAENGRNNLPQRRTPQFVIQYTILMGVWKIRTLRETWKV